MAIVQPRLAWRPLPAKHGKFGHRRRHRAPFEQAEQAEHRAKPQCRQTERCTPPGYLAHTVTGAIGSAACIAGAYIASTRAGGRVNCPALFNRSVYSITVCPWGSQSK
jgi:hypothetical protein